MYFCGPTVYARAHIGNARPFVLGMWLRSWLRATGYDATLVHNITDVNDKIYDAAPGASAELAARATEWYLEDTGDLGLGMPDQLPKATETIPADRRASSRSWSTRGHAYAADGDVYFRVASFPDYGRLSGQTARPGRAERGAERAQGGPARLRALEGEQAGRGHVVGLAVGPRPAGLAHRVLGDGRGDLRAGVRDPRRRARPRLPAPRERARAVARARPRVRADLGAQRDAPVHRREDVEVGRATSSTIREALDAWGREALLVFFLGGHWRKPIDFSRRDDGAGGGAGARRFRNAFTLAAAEQTPAALGRLRRRRSTTTSTRRAALAVMHDWASTGSSSCCGGRSRSSGSTRSPSADEAPAEVVALAEQRGAARDGARLRGRRPAAGRDRRRAGWEMRDEPGGGFTLVRSGDA